MGMGRRSHARYAVWKGDECLGIGTVAELAEKFGVAKQTIWWWASAANKKRDKDNKRKVAERI